MVLKKILKSNNDKQLEVKLDEANDHSIGFIIHDTCVCTIDFWDGLPRVVVYSDLNDPDPTTVLHIKNIPDKKYKHVYNTFPGDKHLTWHNFIGKKESLWAITNLHGPHYMFGTREELVEWRDNVECIEYLAKFETENSMYKFIDFYFKEDVC